jgi:D-serine deaminase-like pyridoxal phosphate-dependent protein
MTAAAALERLERAVGDRDAPLAVVDLDALHANARALVAQAGGLPVRVASKSVRCVDVVRRVLATDGWRGVLAFTPAEACHLADAGVDDLLVAYPSVDRTALCQVARRLADGRPERIVLMVDSAEGAAVVAAAARDVGVRLPVAIDVDTSWRPAPRVVAGVLRSPVRTPEQAAGLARSIVGDAHLELAALMAYDAQVAGLGDDVAGHPVRSRAVRALQSGSLRELAGRVPRVVAAVRSVVEAAGGSLDVVNAGGTGSLSRIRSVDGVTELSAGSGLYAPTLFDSYRSLRLRPAALFALPVVRRPGPGVVTVMGGGYVASGPAGRDRLPTPVLPAGLHLTGTEAAGEVQTPVRGAAADGLRLGDRVWFRHAKAGELCERFDTLVLVSGDEVVAEVPTYRGEGRTFA